MKTAIIRARIPEDLKKSFEAAAAAQRISKRLRGAIKGLVDMPQIGRPVKEMPGELRELIFGRYVVRYKVRGNILYILRIWHSKEHR